MGSNKLLLVGFDYNRLIRRRGDSLGLIRNFERPYFPLVLVESLEETTCYVGVLWFAHSTTSNFIVPSFPSTLIVESLEEIHYFGLV